MINFINLIMDSPAGDAGIIGTILAIVGGIVVYVRNLLSKGNKVKAKLQEVLDFGASAIVLYDTLQDVVADGKVDKAEAEKVLAKAKDSVEKFKEIIEKENK